MSPLSFHTSLLPFWYSTLYMSLFMMVYTGPSGLSDLFILRTSAFTSRMEPWSIVPLRSVTISCAKDESVMIKSAAMLVMMFFMLLCFFVYGTKVGYEEGLWKRHSARDSLFKSFLHNWQQAH